MTDRSIEYIIFDEEKKRYANMHSQNAFIAGCKFIHKILKEKSAPF